MIRVAKGRRQAIEVLGNISVIPPEKRVSAQHLKKAEDCEKDCYPYDEEDQLPELGASANNMDNEVENG